MYTLYYSSILNNCLALKDPNCLPLFCVGRQIGLLRPQVAKDLLQYKDVFQECQSSDKRLVYKNECAAMELNH